MIYLACLLEARTSSFTLPRDFLGLTPGFGLHNQGWESQCCCLMGLELSSHIMGFSRTAKSINKACNYTKARELLQR